MSFSLDTVKKQAIALMNLSVRDTATTPAYTTAIGDTSYASGELDRAIQSAVTTIMQAICETEGHPLRGLFTAPVELDRQTALPKHFGPIGVPRIVPFDGCPYTIPGKRKSFEEIGAYRANPNKYYSPVNHDAKGSNGFHSKLAGFYAIDGENFDFTGFQAISDLADFDEASYTVLPDTLYPLAIDLSIAKLKKDGDVSDIFEYYGASAVAELGWIKQGQQAEPSMQRTIGARDKGDK